MLAKHTSSPRRTHRKRFSAVHLSSDTTATLPEYHQASSGTNPWHRHSPHNSSIENDIPSDKPPDYPDSAEEADEDTDSEDPPRSSTIFAHQLPTGTPTTTAPTTTSPRRKHRFHQQHKRKHSAPTQILTETSPVDPFLDALLERSVHALEMSNTLLQSSMTTQTSLSNVFSCDSPADTGLEAKAMNLSARIKGQWDSQQPPWMNDLEEITKKVDSLFGGSIDLNEDKPEETAGLGVGVRHSRSYNTDAGMSSSLPATSPLQTMKRQRRRPSLDLRAACANAEPSGSARLRLAHRGREDLVAPPPRALTQYIESGADSGFITLPSTLGIRSNTSIYPNSDWNASTASLHSTPALPVVTDTPLTCSSTPAYTKLASFVIKHPSNSAGSSPCSSFTSSFMIKRRNSATATGSLERGRRRSPPPPRRSSELVRSHVILNPSTPLSQQLRPMTPPAEESSSSDGCVARQTISSLRKILDEQPPPPLPEDSKSIASSTAKKSHTFMPVTPPPAAVSGTSTATASISRMLTKKVHHSSTRPPSPPRQSAMKGSRPATPTSATSFTFPTSSSMIFGDTLTIPPRLTVLDRLSPSASSSGRSTPKRISFAELPEAHISSHPEKFKNKGSKRKGKGKSRSIGRGGYDDGFSEEDGGIGMGGWLAAWFGLNPSAGLGATGLTYATRQEERVEDRMGRSWNARSGGGGGCGYPDEWAV